MEYSVRINGLMVDAVYRDADVRDIFLPLLRRLESLKREKGRRILVMMAAPPGAGKSTLASFLESLSRSVPGMTPITVIGMDGFHRRQEYLMSHRAVRDGREVEMVKIKGAPVTFDLELLRERIGRVAAGEECPWPEYDRLIHNPVEGKICVKGRIVLLEGNYLLLDEDGWRELGQYADYTIRITADLDMLRERLIARKAASGTEYEEAVRFVDSSDLYNARLCLGRCVEADLTLRGLRGGGYEVVE